MQLYDGLQFQKRLQVSSYFNNATNHNQFCKKARMDPIF